MNNYGYICSCRLCKVSLNKTCLHVALALEGGRDAERLAEAEMRATAGATYELYARQFSTACARAINKLDPDLRRYAVKIANDHGYIAGEDERYADFGPGLCSLTGIDEHYCHCGRHP